MNPGTNECDIKPAAASHTTRGACAPRCAGRVAVAVLVGAGCAAAVMLAVGGAFVPSAQAGPPAPSSRTLAQRAVEESEVRPFDAGEQRIETIAEIRALRDEVKQLRELLLSGRARVGIANADEIKLEIDYAKLRDALKTP